MSLIWRLQALNGFVSYTITSLRASYQQWRPSKEKRTSEQG